MKNVIIGFEVTKRNLVESRAMLSELKAYMEKDTWWYLMDGWGRGLYVFNVSDKKLSVCKNILEADVQKEVENSGMDYVSMSGHTPAEFTAEVLKAAGEIEESKPSVQPVAEDPNIQSRTVTTTAYLNPLATRTVEEIRYRTDAHSDDSSNPDASISVKNDRKDHKLRWDLIPMEPLNELAKVYTAGADKYGPDRWQNLKDGFDRYRGAACRHLFEYMQGNRYDEETKCMHLAQCAWNIIAMLWLDMHGRGKFPFELLKDEEEEKREAEEMFFRACERNENLYKVSAEAEKAKAEAEKAEEKKLNDEIMDKLQKMADEIVSKETLAKDSPFTKLMDFIQEIRPSKTKNGDNQSAKE